MLGLVAFVLSAFLHTWVMRYSLVCLMARELISTLALAHNYSWAINQGDAVSWIRGRERHLCSGYYSLFPVSQRTTERACKCHQEGTGTDFLSV